MKKAIAYILLFSMLAASLADCASGGEASVTETSAGSQTAQTTETESTTAAYTVPAKDFKGYEFRALTESRTFPDPTFNVAAQNGEVLNDAYYIRNRAIEDKYNVKLTELSVKDPATIATRLVNSVSANTSEFDVFFAETPNILIYGNQGYLYDLFKLPDLDLTQSFWDENAVSDMTVFGKLYTVNGEIHIGGSVIACLLVNMDMLNNYKLDKPFDLIGKNEWTIDKMAAMAKATVKDLDGNGVQDTTDQWGISGTHGMATVHILGNGCSFVSKDKDDAPVFAMDNEKFISEYQKIFKLLDRSYTYMDGGGNNGIYWRNFTEGRALFFGASVSQLYNVADFRSVDMNYILTPVPKSDPKQERYYTYANQQMRMLYVPSVTPDAGRTGLLLQALGAESTDTVYKAFYEVVLGVKGIQDEESRSMLDLIYATRRYDIGALFNWGSIRGNFQLLLYNGSTDIASFIAQNKTKVEAEIEKFKEVS